MAWEEGYVLLPQPDVYPPSTAIGGESEDDWHAVPDFKASKPSTACPPRPFRILTGLGMILALLIGSAFGACVSGQSGYRAAGRFWHKFVPASWSAASPPSGNLLCADAYNQPGCESPETHP